MFVYRMYHKYVSMYIYVCVYVTWNHIFYLLHVMFALYEIK